MKAKSAAQMSLAFVTLSVAPNKISESSPVSEILKGRLLKKKAVESLSTKCYFVSIIGMGLAFERNFLQCLNYLLELEATNPVFFHSFQQWNSFWNKILHKTQIYKGNKPRTWYVLGGEVKGQGCRK